MHTCVPVCAFNANQYARGENVEIDADHGAHVRVSYCTNTNMKGFAEETFCILRRRATLESSGSRSLLSVDYEKEQQPLELCISLSGVTRTPRPGLFA